MQHTASTDQATAGIADAAAVAAQRIEELEQALARAQSLYEQAPCGYLSIDVDLRVVNINQTLKNWLGVPAFCAMVLVVALMVFKHIPGVGL